MIISLGIASLLVMVLLRQLFKLNNQRNYLDQMACVEQTRAQIATELLYEARAKHQNLSLEDTMGLIESIRQEPNPMTRTVIADRIMGEKANSKEKKIGF